MANASLDEDCSNARCVVVNSSCVTTPAGSRRCACVNKNVKISRTGCSMGPSILSSNETFVFSTDLSRTPQTVGLIPLDELSKFPVTFSTEANVYPDEGILDLRSSPGVIDVVLVKAINDAPTFVVVLRATAGEFTVQQVVTVRITSSSFTPEDVTVMLVEGTRRGTLIADVRTDGSLGGYSNYDMETTDDTTRALFIVNNSGQVLCGQDMFLSDFANADTVAKEYIISVTATKGGQVARVATFYILLFRNAFTTMVRENWRGNILSYSITSSRFRIDIKEDTRPDRLELTKDLTTIRLVTGADYEAGIRNINFILDIVTTDNAKSTTVDVRIKIEDQNDEPPEFQKAVYDFSLLAGSKRNSVVGVVSATDRDTGGRTSFHLYGAYKDDFNIDNDGVLTSKVDLTKERFPSTIPLRVQAYDGVAYSNEANITVYLISFTSNAINLNRTFLGNVSESRPPGTPVANVAVSNYTGYKFANSRANNLLKLNLTSGMVTTAIVLDRENTDHAYTDFTIQAYMDSNDQCSPVTIGQLITNVTDINDNAPKFSRSSYTGRVKESSNPGTLVDGLVDVVVTDDDSGENGVVNFALTGTGSNYFAVEKSNHNQFTIKTSGIRIDREVTPYVVLTLTGTDNPSDPQTGTTTLNITVTDVNDNTPRFSNGTTVFSVEENAGPTTITTVTATDEDEGPNRQVSYSLVEGGFGFFEVNGSTGAVSTVKEIDRENRNIFNLSIEARDQGSPSRASVLAITVNILDVNDEKPTFSQTFYKGNYTENTSCTANILTVTATDLDEGSNANIRFSTTSSNFTVDPTSGAIRCANLLDYEEMQQHLIEIKAENPGTPSMSDTVTVEINVEDVNDNSPRFDKTFYQSEITTWEWVTNNPVDVFEVTDNDSGTNGQFTFSMSGHTDKFFIDGETVGVLRIQEVASQPGASTTYNFDVTASDKGSPPRTASVSVSVHVKKIEGNSTVRFSYKEFRFTIVENQQYTTPFGTARASHDVSVPVRYTLIHGGDFHIDPTSGELTSSRPQDREAAPNHTMVVRARDVTTNASDVAVITVTIADVNDNAPKFLTTTAQHVFSVPENAMDGSVGAITAEDEDAGENGTITYSIESQIPRPHFSIDSGTGHITVSGDLDRETVANYSLIIKAMDNAVTPLPATTQATILITDVNDNTPTFTTTAYSVTVRENSTNLSKVTIVTAADRDVGCNGSVSYVADTVMANGTVCPFKVLEDGVVKVSGYLDYETTSTYECIITAVDRHKCSDTARRTGSTTLSVTIFDFNDNPPVFHGAPYRGNISRNAGINSLVTDIITATDRDDKANGNGLVKYHILSNTDYFTINRTTGSIYVATSLDTLNDDEVTLRIKATDLPQTDPPMEAITEITISIITDQPRPYFKKHYTLQAKDNEAPEKGESISIRAYVRRASEEECNCTYEVTDASSFHINSMTGEMRQSLEIDREETGSQFYVTVKATDLHSRYYRTTNVKVIVDDVNDNLPYFNSTEQKFILNESTPVGYMIGHVTSFDPDENSKPRYTIIQGHDAVELLSNGTLVVRASLLNYTDIRMFVKVTEDDFDGRVNNTLPTDTQVSIEVRPDDYNENAPKFVHEKYETSMNFLAEVGAEVHIDDFRATDADGHNITYGIKTRNDRGNLNINNKTGTISVGIRFDDTVPTILKLIIEATDESPHSRTGSCTVLITLKDFTATECIVENEYLRLQQDRQQRELFLGLFIAMAVLLGLISIVAVFACYKWRTVRRGIQYHENIQTARAKEGKESGDGGYDNLGAREEDTPYNPLRDRDFSAGVPNPAYVSSGPRPACVPPAEPHPFQRQSSNYRI
ncbi:protocadherin Fat 4-like isoform X2 [Haliotis asinina]|uniref:protocadherin Fat 4-like isoform X2 n=1 Tax=Haliotis asinina TaxID=109174 RepID=UPI0035323370